MQRRLMSAVYILTLSLSLAFWYASFMWLLIQGPVIDRREKLFFPDRKFKSMSNGFSLF